MYKYILERKEIVPIRAIGNTSTYCDYSYRWKGIAVSNNLNALKNYCGKDMRIVDRNTLQTVWRGE